MSSYLSPYEPEAADRSCHGLPGNDLPWESSYTLKPLPLKQEEATTNGNSLLGALSSPLYHTIRSVPNSPSTLKGSTPPPPPAPAPPPPPPLLLPQSAHMSGALAPPSNGIPAQPSKSKEKVRPRVTRDGKHFRRGPHRLSPHELEQLVMLGEMVQKKRELVRKRRARVNSLCDKFREDILALFSEIANEDRDGVCDDTTDDWDFFRVSGLNVKQLGFNGELAYKLEFVVPVNTC